ncbi:PilZ domain-containing protein [Breoghania sp. L-A4]|uniref:PilZ domain-containing protein n=1 Tax=Breoghania sp. L-A4 TaxID=2304600 RepID=UPI000E3599E6|nr:PilZ domain-containing protein [Breoghania sp. L-A4]AXS42644.1 PilZ domain-containing protein [Breoghania sp. L-A4]
MRSAQANARVANIAARKQDRRRHQRVGVSLLGRFMLENRREYPCQVSDMSPGGAALIAPVTGEVGERVIAYIDHLGRIEGKIVRHIEGGFAMTLNATARKRDKLASQLTWLANRHELNLPEDRRHDRFTPDSSASRIILPDGREYPCRVVDVSMSGAALAIEVKPAIGTAISLGKMRARVIRHTEDGVAVEFGAVQNINVLKNQITI